MTRRHVAPSPPLRGGLTLPGDKSISHRAVLLNLCAPGTATLSGLSSGDDVQRSLDVAQSLGAVVRQEEGRVHLTAPRALVQPSAPLDCGNSGTTMRLTTGLLACSTVHATLTGDPSLRRRPMARISDPIGAMGGSVHRLEGGDVCVEGVPLRHATHRTTVASAQVKSALLLAARHSGVVLFEPRQSRDHTERMLVQMGANLSVAPEGGLHLAPGGWSPTDVVIPGDLSSAAFWLVAASIVPDSEVILSGVGLNPTRTGVLDALRAMGADITVESDGAYEPMGRVVVRSAQLQGTTIDGELTLRALDELPVLAVAAAFAEGTTYIRDARELRVKESDRIGATVSGLRSMGIETEELDDGLVVVGGQARQRGDIHAPHDHRIAMAFAVAGLASPQGCTLTGADSVQTSYPEFFQTMDRLTGGRR